MSEHIFTPLAGTYFEPEEIDDMGRVWMILSDKDIAKIGRGERWSARITDLKTGRRFTVRDASCGLVRCRCAAQITRELKATKGVK